jgi:hypothetical protein
MPEPGLSPAEGIHSEGLPFGFPSAVPLPIADALSLPPAPPPKALEEQISDLRRLIGEKDHAVIRAVVSTSQLQQELETSRAEAAALRSQLEVMQATPQFAEKTAVAAEVAKIVAQYKVAQKTVERVQNQLRSELVGVKARWQQSQQQLESERKSRQTESAAATRKILALERSLADAESKAAAPRPNGRRLPLALAASGLSVAVIMAGFLLWARIPHTVSAAAAQRKMQQKDVLPALSMRPIAQIPEVSVGPREFQVAMGRLNNALANFNGRNPEDILNDVRHASHDATVCAFQWNDGQPALLYGGKNVGISLASSLNRCAQAVESVLAR